MRAERRGTSIVYASQTNVLVDLATELLVSRAGRWCRAGHGVARAGVRSHGGVIAIGALLAGALVPAGSSLVLARPQDQGS